MHVLAMASMLLVGLSMIVPLLDCFHNCICNYRPGSSGNFGESGTASRSITRLAFLKGTRHGCPYVELASNWDGSWDPSPQSLGRQRRGARSLEKCLVQPGADTVKRKSQPVARSRPEPSEFRL